MGRLICKTLTSGDTLTAEEHQSTQLQLSTALPTLRISPANLRMAETLHCNVGFSLTVLSPEASVNASRSKSLKEARRRPDASAAFGYWEAEILRLKAFRNHEKAAPPISIFSFFTSFPI